MGKILGTALYHILTLGIAALYKWIARKSSEKKIIKASGINDAGDVSKQL